MTEKNWLAGESAWRKRLPHENVNPCSPMWGRRFRLPNGASSSLWVGQLAHGRSLPVAARNDAAFFESVTEPRPAGSVTQPGDAKPNPAPARNRPVDPANLQSRSKCARAHPLRPPAQI